MNTLPRILLTSLQKNPDRIALHVLEGNAATPVSFRRLVERATGFASALDRAGVRPGEVVVLILQHGEALVAGFFGAMLQGAIPSILPFLTEKLSPELYRKSLAALVEISRPAAVVTYAGFADEVRAALTAGSSVRAVLLSEEIIPLAELGGQFPGLDRSPSEICLLQHSSGTTGLQKGVALSHEAVLNQIECYAAVIGMTEADTVVSWLPLYHDMGLIAGFLMPILRQAPLVLMSPFDWVRAPWRLLRAVSDYRGTLSWLPNFAYNFCASKIRDRELEGIDLSSWRAVINCSEPMRLSSHRAFLERFRSHGLRPEALATCYAMAENVFAVSQGGIGAPVTVDPVDPRSLIVDRVARTAREGDDQLEMVSAGRPIPNSRVRILDDARRELPERHIGEIAVLSDCMLTGYYNRKDLTEKTFHEGWYLTGDLGYLANGEVYVTGRKKDLIIVGGKNVYPQDLEELAGQVEGVHPGRVVAFGVFNEQSGTEDVVVVAEAEAADEGQRRRIGDEIRGLVNRGSDVALRYVKIVEPRWLLKTSSGKIARSANREKYLAEAEQERQPDPLG